MTNTLRIRLLAPALTILTCLAGVLPAGAQLLPIAAGATDTRADDRAPSMQPTLFRRPSLLKPFTDLVGDIRHVPTRDNLTWLVIGLGAAAGAHSMDSDATHHLSQLRSQPYKPGAIVGGTPLELGAAFATYAIGRATDSPRAIALGGDLIRAQLLAELMTTGVKQTIRRARPEGTGFSFPSGHTAVTFASATVLQQHFGWKVGIPAYAVASYVAASRVQMKRHYLSDVTFGAAVGLVAGRTVTLGRGTRFALSPIASPDGGGLSLTWLGKK